MFRSSLDDSLVGQLHVPQMCKINKWRGIHMAFRGFGCAAQIKEFTCFSMVLHAQNQEFTCFPCGYRQSHIFYTKLYRWNMWRHCHLTTDVINEVIKHDIHDVLFNLDKDTLLRPVVNFAEARYILMPEDTLIARNISKFRWSRMQLKRWWCG